MYLSFFEALIIQSLALTACFSISFRDQGSSHICESSMNYLFPQSMKSTFTFFPLTFIDQFLLERIKARYSSPSQGAAQSAPLTSSSLFAGLSLFLVSSAQILSMVAQLLEGCRKTVSPSSTQENLPMNLLGSSPSWFKGQNLMRLALQIPFPPSLALFSIALYASFPPAYLSAQIQESARSISCSDFPPTKVMTPEKELLSLRQSLMLTITDLFFIFLSYSLRNYSFMDFTYSSWGLMLWGKTPSSLTFNNMFLSSSQTRQVTESRCPSSTPTSFSAIFLRISILLQVQNSSFWLLGTVRSSGLQIPMSLLCNPLSFSFDLFSNSFSLMQRIELTNYSLTKPQPCSTIKLSTSFESFALTIEPVIFSPVSLWRQTLTSCPISCFLANSRQLKAPTQSPTGLRTIASSILTFSSFPFLITSKTQPSKTSLTSPTKLFFAQMKLNISVCLLKIPLCSSLASDSVESSSQAYWGWTFIIADEFTIPQPFFKIQSQILCSSCATIQNCLRTRLQIGRWRVIFIVGLLLKNVANYFYSRQQSIRLIFFNLKGRQISSCSLWILTTISSEKYSSFPFTVSPLGKYFRIFFLFSRRPTIFFASKSSFFWTLRNLALTSLEQILLSSSSLGTTSIAPQASFSVRKASF